MKRIINEVQKKKDEIKENMREIYINNSKRNIINIKINTNKSKENQNFLLYNSFEEIEVWSDFEIIQPIECHEKKNILIHLNMMNLS